MLIHEGEPGDLFYVIADGEVRVSTAAGFTTTLAHGDGFGEIALLNDGPRTATVTATTETSLYTLTSDDFLTAVTGMTDVAPRGARAGRRSARRAGRRPSSRDDSPHT